MTFSKKRILATAGLCAVLAFVPAVAFADDKAASDPSDTQGAALVLPSTATPASFTEEELDTVVGVYSYGGGAHEITARQAIEDSMSLESDLLADGTYAAPSADLIMAYARNRILDELVQQEGITVSDEELAAYALQTLGTDDIATIAQYYGMGEDQARAILTEAAAVVKLRDQVVGQLPAAPQAPTAPVDGDTAAALDSYGSYILDTVGAAWNAESGTWADSTSAYAQALPDFDGGAATLEQAQAAYYVAYSVYQQAAAQQLAQWQSYANDYLGDATVQIYTLRS